MIQERANNPVGLETSSNCCAKKEESRHGGEQLEYQCPVFVFCGTIKVLKMCVSICQKRREEIPLLQVQESQALSKVFGKEETISFDPPPSGNPTF